MLTKILNWMNETNGYTRGGAPMPNWFFLVCLIFVFIFFFIEINNISKRKKKNKSKKPPEETNPAEKTPFGKNKKQTTIREKS